MRLSLLKTPEFAAQLGPSTLIHRNCPDTISISSASNIRVAFPGMEVPEIGEIVDTVDIGIWLLVDIGIWLVVDINSFRAVYRLSLFARTSVCNL